jgi:hypothetical protein
MGSRAPLSRVKCGHGEPPGVVVDAHEKKKYEH